MPTHWTYKDFQSTEDLEQGDIIQPTEDIRAVLQAAHKHFLDPKYSAFIILTQSCDIVRRKENPCKTRYINLAVIRPLDNVLLSFLDAECERIKIDDVSIDGLYAGEDKPRARQLLSRIINQNEHGLGLFYLHADADAGIAVPSVALLQVSIALRREHYSALVKARSGRLTAEFQSRLGWIIGNLYSRVATQDFGDAKSKEIIEDILDTGKQSGKGPMWINRTCAAAAQGKGVKVKDSPLGDIVASINLHKPTPPMSVAIDRAIAIVQDVTQTSDAEKLQKVRNRLANDQIFASTFK